MNSLHHDLARAIQAEHLASARQRHLAREVRRARRDDKRAERTDSRLNRFRAWVARVRHRPRTTLAVAADPPDSPASVRPVDVPTQLELLLDILADQIVELGTRTEAPSLETLARAAGDVSPGAAAALVDWDGSEIARLRAFSIVQEVILRDLNLLQQSCLLDRLNGSDELPLVG